MATIEDIQQQAQDQKDKKDFRSKVILSGLPPSITEEHCHQLLTPFLPHLRTFLFLPGHTASTALRCASVILSFTSADTLLDFVSKWHNKQTKEGGRLFTTTVRFAPIQTHYKYDSLKRKSGQRANLENWDLFKEFVEEMTESQGGESVGVDSFLNAEKQSEVLREAERKARPWQYDPNYVKSTPLLEHMKSMTEKSEGKSKKKKQKNPSASASTSASTSTGASTITATAEEPKKKAKKKNKKKTKSADETTSSRSSIGTSGTTTTTSTAKVDLNKEPTVKNIEAPKEESELGFFIDTVPSDQSIYSIPVTVKKQSTPTTNSRKSKDAKEVDLEIYDSVPVVPPKQQQTLKNQKVKLASRPPQTDKQPSGPQLVRLAPPKPDSNTVTTIATDTATNTQKPKKTFTTKTLRKSDP